MLLLKHPVAVGTVVAMTLPPYHMRVPLLLACAAVEGDTKDEEAGVLGWGCGPGSAGTGLRLAAARGGRASAAGEVGCLLIPELVN